MVLSDWSFQLSRLEPDLIEQLLRAPDSEETLKAVVRRGVPLDKWRIFARVCAPDPARGKTEADLAREMGRSRARICQIVNEVKATLSDDPYSLTWKLYQRRSHVALEYLDLKEGVSAGAFWRNEFAPDYVCVCGNRRWRPFTQGVYGLRSWLQVPINLDLSSFEVYRFGKKITTPQKAGLKCPSYNIVWCCEEGAVVPTDWVCAGRHVGRYEVLLFNCDGDFYTYDDVERDSLNRIVCVWVKPIDLRIKCG